MPCYACEAVLIAMNTIDDFTKSSVAISSRQKFCNESGISRSRNRLMSKQGPQVKLL